MSPPPWFTEDHLGRKNENTTRKLIKSQWCKRLYSITGANNKLCSMITGTYGRIILALKETRNHRATLKLFKRAGQRSWNRRHSLQTREALSRKGRMSVGPQQKRSVDASKHDLRSRPDRPMTHDIIGHVGQGEVRWDSRTQAELQVDRGREKGRVRQRKSVVAERGPSDLLPWQDDKTVRNAVERGKRSDQELKNKKRGEK